MTYKKFLNRYFVKIENGEEIIVCLNKFLTEMKIEAGFIQGIGFANRLDVSYFSTVEKKHSKKTFSGNFVINSIQGNISLLEGNVFLNLNIVFSDNKFKTYGGHIESAYSAGSCEIVVVQFEEDALKRSYDKDSGLNVLNI
jgi:uncharacterized protein